MSIIQVTPTEVIEHPTFASEEPHPRLNTVEAMRYIAGLSNGQRKEFDAIVDADGNPDPRAQELYMIHEWTFADDEESVNALAGHRSTRALQSVRHFLTRDLHDKHGTEEKKRYYFPLLEMPQAPHLADLHWDQESRFRRGIGHVFDQAANLLRFAPNPVELPALVRGTVPPEDQRRYELSLTEHSWHVGQIALSNEVQVSEEQIVGSVYEFTKNVYLPRVLNNVVKLELGIPLGSQSR